MRSMLGIFWLMVVIGVMGIIFVGSKPNTNSKQEDRNGPPTEHNGDAHFFTAKESNKEAKSGTEDHKQKNEGGAIRRTLVAFMDAVEARDKFFTAFGTIIIAGFTVGLACATLFLYWATKDLVKGADETAERQLRAYIGLDQAETTVYPFEQGGFAFIAHAEFKNYGQTPAHDVTIKTNVKIDVPGNVPFDDFPGLERGEPIIAFKDVSFHARMGWPISQEDKIALYERKKVFFMWGVIDYKDVFDKPHRFKFHLISAEIATGTGGVYNMNSHKPGFEGY